MPDTALADSRPRRPRRRSTRPACGWSPTGSSSDRPATSASVSTTTASSSAPAGVRYDELGPDDHPVVDGRDGSWTGPREPTSEIALHTGLMGALPDVGAVVHTHSRYAAAFSVARLDLPFICNESIATRAERVLVTSYAPPGTARPRRERAPHAVRPAGQPGRAARQPRRRRHRARSRRRLCRRPVGGVDGGDLSSRPHLVRRRRGRARPRSGGAGGDRPHLRRDDRPAARRGPKRPLTGERMRIGICTGGGDVPGLNPCIKAVVTRVADGGHDVVGIRRGWAGLLETDPDDPASAAANTVPLDRQRRAHHRSHRRDDPPHVAHQPRPGAARPGPAVPRRRGGRRRAVRLHPARRPGDRASRARRPDPDRRRRHPLLRAAPARRGRAGHRDPEDDGQRRPRHRLLHRVLDRGHPGRRVHPRPAHVDRLATSASP